MSGKKCGGTHESIRSTGAEPRAGYRIWLRYSDGAIDLARFAGQAAFEARRERAFFEAVRAAASGAVARGEGIELCPDALPVQITGNSVEDVMPGLWVSPHRAEP